MNTDFMFRVWDVVNKCYVDSKQNILTIDSNGYLLINEMPVDDDKYIIEKCTGYKCVDGNYLYEGDYVEWKLGLKMVQARILFEHFCFWVYEVRGGCMLFNQQQYKLIGNKNTNPI